MKTQTLEKYLSQLERCLVSISFRTIHIPNSNIAILGIRTGSRTGNIRNLVSK